MSIAVIAVEAFEAPAVVVLSDPAAKLVVSPEATAKVKSAVAWSPFTFRVSKRLPDAPVSPVLVAVNKSPRTVPSSAVAAIKAVFSVFMFASVDADV